MIAVVCVAAALRAARPVLLPLCVALFLAVMLWPVQRRLARRMPAWAAAAFLGVGLFVTSFGVGAGVGLIIASARGQLTGSLSRVRESLDRAGAWLGELGLPGGPVSLPQRLPEEALARLTAFAFSGLHGTLELVVAPALTLFLAVLALSEAPRWEARLERVFGPERARVVCGGFHEASRDFSRYMVATSISGLCAGTLTAGLCFLVGVPMALLWGLLSFLLNFVPNLGVFLSAIPPALLALAYAGPGGGAAMIAGLIIIEMLTGNVLAPILTGRAMGLSPLTVMASVLVWAMLWGAAGALMAAPMTVAIVIAMRRCAPTRRAAQLLVDRETSRRWFGTAADAPRGNANPGFPGAAARTS